MPSKAALLDPKVKAAKKKKQAIVLGVLMLAVMAFQIPRTLKMMSAKPPPAVAAPAPVAPAPAPATATGAPSGATPAATAPTGKTSSATVGADALVVNADLQPAPLEGQLPDLTSFSAKDPFIQQDRTAPVAPGKGSGGSGGTGSTGTAPAGGTPPGSTGGVAPGGTGQGVTPPAPTTPAPPPPTSAVLSVNGVQEPVNVNADFPQANPLFRLVALTAKTAKIGIAGGSLSSGAAAVTIELGKPTTLMNTADGTRYAILLVSTGGSATP